MILDIVTQTDFAGAIEAAYHCPGAARLGGLLRCIRQENPAGTLFLDAGDVLCGAPITNLTMARRSSACWRRWAWTR